MLGHKVTIVTSAVNEARWRDELRQFQVRQLAARDWLDVLGGRELWIARRVRQLSPLIADMDVAIAHNYPMSRVLAHARTTCRKIWYCNEPYREIHLAAAHPTLAARSRDGAAPTTMADVHFRRKFAKQQKWAFNLDQKFVGEGRRDLRTVNKIDLLCANSNYARELAIRTYGPRPCKVLYPAIQFPASSERRHGLGRSQLRVLAHTRLVPEKNVDTVLRGFAQFVGRAKLNASLSVVGEGPCREPLERLARELGVEQLVRFHGFVSELELRRIYDNCDVFALLPIDEPFGMVFPEAAARGLLLIGPDHGGPLEIMEGGKNGFAADTFSPASLADVFERITQLSDEEIERTRDRAEESCRRRFSEKAIASQIESVYELTK